MILVTGAAGKTGRSIVQALAERELAVRALVRHPDQLPGLKALGADQDTLESVFQAPSERDRVFQKNEKAAKNNPNNISKCMNVLMA